MKNILPLFDWTKILLTSVFGVALLVLPQAPVARAEMPWVPTQGEFDFTFGFQHESFDDFYMGKDKMEFPPEFTQRTWMLNATAGITDQLAFDAYIGFTGTSGFSDASELEDEDGLDDSKLGVRYMAIEEDDTLIPTVTFGLAWILPGTYDDNVFPTAPGVGAWGGQGSLLLGKQLIAYDAFAYGIYGEGSYRINSNPVPNQWYWRGGTYFNFFQTATLSAELNGSNSQGGIDIGGEGFAPTLSRRLNTDRTRVQVGISGDVMDSASLFFYWAETIDGRNTGDTRVLGGGATIRFM